MLFCNLWLIFSYKGRDSRLNNSCTSSTFFFSILNNLMIDKEEKIFSEGSEENRIENCIKTDLLKRDL